MKRSSAPLVEDLWNKEITNSNYGSKEQYFEHIFAQYKIFVESARAISDRRNQANTFFLTLHTFLILLLQFLYEIDPAVSSILPVIFTLIPLLILCYVWWRLLRSYRQLNTAKFKVIGEYEKFLPSSPFWQGEWLALGEGKDPTLYTPLTSLENWIPIIFALIYILGAIAVIFI